MNNVMHIQTIDYIGKIIYEEMRNLYILTGPLNDNFILLKYYIQPFHYSFINENNYIHIIKQAFSINEINAASFKYAKEMHESTLKTIIYITRLDYIKSVINKNENLEKVEKVEKVEKIEKKEPMKKDLVYNEHDLICVFLDDCCKSPITENSAKIDIINFDLMYCLFIYWVHKYKIQKEEEQFNFIGHIIDFQNFKTFVIDYCKKNVSKYPHFLIVNRSFKTYIQGISLIMNHSINDAIINLPERFVISRKIKRRG